MYPYTATVVIFLLLCTAVVVLFTKRGNLLGKEALFAYPDLQFLLPLYLTAAYLAYASQTGGIDWKMAGWVFVYLAAPVLLIPNSGRNRLTLWDGLAILSLWLPFDLHLMGRRTGAIRGALDYPLLAISAVIICLVCWVCSGRLDGTKTRFASRPGALKLVVKILFALAVILIPVGLATHFLVINPPHLTTAWQKFSAGLIFVGALKLTITIIAKLSEELLFRGIIQNFLQQTWKKERTALIVASLLFGAAHLNNGATSADFYGWNWKYAAFAAVAGVAYGKAFQKTPSILYSTALHVAADMIWGLALR